MEISALKQDPEIQEVLYADNPYLNEKNIIYAKSPEKYAPPTVMTPYNAIAMGVFNSAMQGLVTGEYSDINTALREQA